MSDPRGCGHCALVFWLLLGGVMVVGVAAEKLCPCVFLEEAQDWSLLSGALCCVNVSLQVGTLDWAIFTRMPGLRVLDLSDAGVVRITDAEQGKNQTNLEVLYLDNNELEELPHDFLRNAPDLKVLHLENNKLKGLPNTMLQASNQIQEIYLSFNRLTSLPVHLLKSSLTRLDFRNNSLECSCSLHQELEPALRDNATAALLEGVLCSSPEELRGVPISELSGGKVCRSHGVTIALICVPLAVLLLLGCWYFCCRRGHKVKYTTADRECRLVTVDRNGTGADYHHYEPQQSFQKDKREPGGGPAQFRDPILLKPSTALLGSSRDLYEEVEIKLGTSEDCLMNGEGGAGREGHGLALALEEEAEEAEEEAEEEAAGLPEADAVSVTEVLKDSADREKLYLSQATDYYSLMPGIELEDSDHGEYENIDLS